MTIWTWEWWRAAGERAIKTFAQSLIAVIGVEQVSVLSLDWAQILSVAATAAVISVLTSIASSPFRAYGPSLGPEELIPPKPSVLIPPNLFDDEEDLS